MNGRARFGICHALIATAVCSHAASIHAQNDAQRVFGLVSPSIVTVHALDENSRLEGQGSGIIIGAGKVATNCHVVRDAHSLKVRTAKGELSATWVTRDPTRDLCLLTVVGLDGTVARIRAYKELAVGERVFAVGNPLGFELSVSEGLISALTQVRGEPTLITNAALSPGSSGGGLFDMQGRLVGVTTAILGIGQNLNLVLPADWINELNSRGIVASPASAPPAPEPRWNQEAEALRAKLDWKALEPYARKWLEAHPTSSKAGYFLGVAVVRQGRKEEAETILRNALRNDEHDATAWAYLGSILREPGKKADADTALDRAMSIRTQGYFYQVRSEWLQAEKRFDEAKVEMDRALALFPDNADSWITLGVIESNRQQLQAAARAFRVALRIDPKNERVRPLLADVLARSGQINQARETLGNTAVQGNTQIGVANANTWLAVGNKELAARRFTDAESAFRKVLEAAPDSHQAWWGLGAVFASSGRAGEAEDAFLRSLKIRPEYGGSHWALGQLQERRGDLPAALASYKRAAEYEPGNAAAWASLGNLAHRMLDFRESAVAFRRLADSGKAGAPVYVSLGEALLRTGQIEAAREAIQTAEKLAPDDATVLQGLAMFSGQAGDYPRALEYAERAIAKSPASEIGWSSKGYSLLRLGRFTDAIAALDTAVGLAPNSANALINLGEARLRNRDFGMAIRVLHRALQVNPNALDAHFFAAQAYFSVKQLAKAREHAQAMLAQRPELPQALALLTMADVVEGKNAEALENFNRLRARDPALAAVVRKQAVAVSSAASALPE
jgi:tetratricopeptide (TPR) repeat protein